MTANETKGQIGDLVLSVYQIHEAVLAQTGGIAPRISLTEVQPLISSNQNYLIP